MAFRDDIKDDLAIFVNCDEFAETAVVDGIECPCQRMSYSADKSNRLQETFEGLFGSFCELFLELEPYLAAHHKLPHRNDIVIVNGNRYEVVKSENELGLLHLILSAYRANRPRYGDRRND